MFPQEILKNQVVEVHFSSILSHFNPPSQIKRTFAVREGAQTHPPHPLPKAVPLEMVWLQI